MAAATVSGRTRSSSTRSSCGLSSRVHETARLGGFFGAIRDSMPDAWGRLVIDRRAGVTGSDEFDYLLQGPDDRAGALGFGEEVEPPAPVRRLARASDLDRLRRAADAIVDGRPERAGRAGRQVEELLFPGTSLGGARPKAVVEDGRVLWIAKFGRRNDRWNHPRVEHGLLSLARAAGLNARRQPPRDGGRPRRAARAPLRIATVRRMAGGDTAWSARSPCSARATASATGGTGRISPWPTRSGAPAPIRGPIFASCFGRMCFNAAVSNLDDHPRNHAMVAVGRRAGG